jgi:protoheme IX farnesyltransferase
MSTTIRNYWSITKPGIIFGNLISVTSGFFLASRGSIDAALLVSTILGISLVIASGCVLNNFIDRGVDRLMSRTRNRALAKGTVSPKAAVLYACLLGIGGMVLLWTATNLLTLAIAAAGFVIYVFVYSLLKHHSVYAPLIGSLAGAAPPLAGYCAVSNHFDLGAVILLSIFSLWQMPHFYSIAIYRLEDYAAAAIPVLPVKRGISAAKKHIIVYLSAFVAATLLLTLVGYTGYRYFGVAVVLGAVWLSMAWAGYKTMDNKRWARKLFACSIVTIFSLSVMMSIDFTKPAAVPMPASYPSQGTTAQESTSQAVVSTSPVSFNP